MQRVVGPRVERRPPHPEADDDGDLERSFSGDGDGGRTGASPAGSTPMTAGEGGGAASPAGSGRHIFFSFLLLFWLNILDLVGYVCGFTKNFAVFLLDPV
jgi:hypothetical protein